MLVTERVSTAVNILLFRQRLWPQWIAICSNQFFGLMLLLLLTCWDLYTWLRLFLWNVPRVLWQRTLFTRWLLPMLLAWLFVFLVFRYWDWYHVSASSFKHGLRAGSCADLCNSGAAAIVLHHFFISWWDGRHRLNNRNLFPCSPCYFLWWCVWYWSSWRLGRLSLFNNVRMIGCLQFLQLLAFL